MPTKEDIRIMVASIEEAHKEIQEVRDKVAHLGTQMDAAEAVSATVEARLEQLETAQHAAEAIKTHLFLEDQDDRCRQNNIRIKGLPEMEGKEDLQTLLQALFKLILDSPDPVRLDRAYRLMGA